VISLVLTMALPRWPIFRVMRLPALGAVRPFSLGWKSCARNIAASALGAMPRRSDVGAERVRRSTASEMSAQRPQTMPSASERVPADASRTWLLRSPRGSAEASNG
jgi:hypothetical protein